MAKFVQCSSRGTVYYINVEQIRYLQRAVADNYTAVHFDKDHTMSVQETPEQIVKGGED
jgi:hypothetical protein